MTRRRVDGSVEYRFWRCVTVTPGCWLWTGEITHQGYGRMSVKTDARFTQKGSAPAHVVSYRLNVGEIPEGLVIDHRCFVKNCVNPAHLEAVTQQVNIQRYWQQAPLERKNPTTCKNGHDLTGPNPYYVNGPTGARQCRACVREGQKRRYDAKGRR